MVGKIEVGDMSKRYRIPPLIAAVLLVFLSWFSYQVVLYKWRRHEVQNLARLIESGRPKSLPELNEVIMINGYTLNPSPTLPKVWLDENGTTGFFLQREGALGYSGQVIVESKGGKITDIMVSPW